MKPVLNKTKTATPEELLAQLARAAKVVESWEIPVSKRFKRDSRGLAMEIHSDVALIGKEVSDVLMEIHAGLAKRFGIKPKIDVEPK